MKILRLIPVLCAAFACAKNDGPDRNGAASPDTEAGGRIYHYVRSNVDGSDKEDVYVFLRKPDKLEVYKAREKCTNAALVTASLDLDEGYATKIIGGRLLPDAKHEEFAFLTFDPRTRKISARIELPDGKTLKDDAVIDRLPWHLYDFDFASLTATAPSLEKRKDFAFGLALIIADPNRTDFLEYLGTAEATYRRDETYAGRPAMRYVLGGPAFGNFGGSLWLDEAEGYILGVETGFPNHLEYHDFNLTLEGIDQGADAWTALLKAHFEGCEKKS
jgi:hypothetical protein